MVEWCKWRRLLDETVDQIHGVDSRVPWDVVDRLFRVERGALPASRIQRIDDMALHLQHAALKHGEQPDRAGTDNRDIGTMEHILHAPHLSRDAVARKDAAVAHDLRKKILRVRVSWG